ncbi:MAG: hypothetical protein HY939_07715, partial [Gammaproteobacteria bacterium]|nr:hypothetical protein [Gammaproteobacteria bacterium]
MNTPTWKADLLTLSTHYKAELASFEVWALNKETKLRTHPDLLRACEGYDLKNVLTLCDKAIAEADSPEAFEASFIAILATHWEQTTETALSYLAYP